MTVTSQWRIFNAQRRRTDWTPKPPKMTGGDAAALPASAEAAVGTLKQLGLTGGETLLVLGAAGSVGMIATQLAVSRGATASAPRDHESVRDLGAVRLRRQRHLHMEHAAEAHRLLENGEVHEKLILDTR